MTMPVSNLTDNSFNNLISSSQKSASQPSVQNIQEPVKEAPIAKKQSMQDDIFDKINNKVINSKDVTDTVTLPRAIFKGYLSFFLSSTLLGLTAINPAKTAKINNPLRVASSLLAIVGTFEFLKPLLLKQKSEDKKA